MVLPPRLQALVQAESLFNDATSLVLFRIAIAAALPGGVAGWTGVASDFALLAVGGAAIGAVVAAGVALVRRRTEDPVLESVIALVTPYLAYVLAEIAHSSGVTAVVVAVASWAGARGVVPLAATLSIPLADAAGQPLPYRDLLMVVATGVIVISLLVQGFTLAPLVRLSRLAVSPHDSHAEYVRGRRKLAELAVTYLDELADLEAASPTVLERVRHSLHIRMELEQERDDDTGDAGDLYSRIRRDVLAVQSDALARMYAAGEIGERTRRRLQRHLDREDLRFTDD